MIQDLSFLKVSSEEQKVIQDREQYLYSTVREKFEKEYPDMTFFGNYKSFLDDKYIDLNKLEGYYKALKELQEKRRNRMLIEIQNQLKIIERLNYKFVDSNIETVSKLSLKDFGISQFPFWDDNGFKPFSVYNLNSSRNDLSFKHRADFNGPDDILSLNEIDIDNKNAIFEITIALNEIYFMLRHFKEAY